MLLALPWARWLGLAVAVTGPARGRDGPLVVRTPATAVLELARGRVLWAAGRTRLRCHSGVLWVTQGDGTDRVLAAGDVLDVERRQPALLHALRDARFTLAPLRAP